MAMDAIFRDLEGQNLSKWPAVLLILIQRVRLARLQLALLIADDRKFSQIQSMYHASSSSKVLVKPVKPGNCKFGAKCSLEHVLPDGRRVDKSGRNGHLSIGGRVNPPVYPHQGSNITNSILLRQEYDAGYGPSMYPYAQPEEIASLQARRPAYDHGQSMDAGVTSNPGSNYGSPPDESRFVTMSPNRRHLTALDVPLPNSFDSNGVSNYARHGPFGTSVPSKFGVDSPPQSIPNKSNAPSDTVRTLHDTAFGPASRRNQGLASSPPQGIGSGYESNIGARLMHSQKAARPRLISQSVPRTSIAEDWDDNFTTEEDLLPTNLHDDVLTPQEKTRRLSRPEHDMVPKEIGGGLGIPSATSSKVGSPLASSPSRFSDFFVRQRKRKEEDGAGLSSSPFGPVGSPLRESSLSNYPAASMQSSATRLSSGDARNPMSSPVRTPSVGLLASQLARQNLNRGEPNEQGSTLHPSSARHASAPIPIKGRFDRTISSPGLNTTRIEEEIFSMEEMESLDDGRQGGIEGTASNSQASKESMKARSPADASERHHFYKDVKSIRFGDT
ncbi:MAG: hypothetical protein Q9227_001942 [Pyrenula ochraceoflavens]